MHTTERQEGKETRWGLPLYPESNSMVKMPKTRAVVNCSETLVYLPIRLCGSFKGLGPPSWVPQAGKVDCD